jgi:hypothetical protein
MIVFIEGPDGSGKTTLTTGLSQELAKLELRTAICRPLWQFLPFLDRPESFAAWVITTPGEEVGQALLSAMTAQIALIAEQCSSGRIVLVDRGPTTVECSARAHAGPAAATATFITAHEELQRHMLSLTASTDCRAVHLTTSGSQSDLRRRLSADETITSRYSTYLAALNENFRQSRHWPGIPTMDLNTWNPAQENLKKALNGILALPMNSRHRLNCGFD